MTNSKTTKRALFSSVVALLLCFTMLLGTTFAWFTDTATSATNKIVAGNLDVELYHADKAQPTDELVGSTTKLFDDVTLWEPGAIVWEKLTVKNAGSLALKYVLSVNVADISTVNGKSLADVLKVAVLTEEPTRENVTTAATQDLATFNLASDKALMPGAAPDEFYVAIYWAPSANDNDYNVANEALYANLGVTLLATQYTAESDSFDNQYDKDSLYTAIVDPINGAVIRIGSTSTGMLTITVPVAAIADGVTVLNANVSTPTFRDIIPEDAVTTLKRAISLDISIDGIKENNTTPITVEYVVPSTEDFEAAEVYHNGTAIDGETYDAETRTVTFTTTSFSPYEFVMDTGATVIPQSYTNDQAITLLTNAKDGAKIDGLDRTITFADNVANKWSFLIQNGVTFQNMTLTAKGQGTTVMIYGQNKNIKMKNVTFQNTTFGKKALEISTNSRQSLEFEDCTVMGKPYVQGTNVKFTRCSFNTNMNLESASNVTFEGCSFTASGAVTMNSGLTNILFENNNFKYTNAIRLYSGMSQPTNVQFIGNTYKTTLVKPDSGVDYEGWKTNGAWIEQDNIQQ